MEKNSYNKSILNPNYTKVQKITIIKGNIKDNNGLNNNEINNNKKYKFFNDKIKIIDLKNNINNKESNYPNNITQKQECRIQELNPQKKIIKKLRRSISSQKIAKSDNKNIIKKRNIPKFEDIFTLPKAIHRQYVPGIIGLKNLSSTCYMNATLQCFSGVVRLREYLINKYKDLEKNKNSSINSTKLSYALAEVLNNLWKNLNKSYYSPDNFRRVLFEMFPNIYNGNSANDPKDLIIFLLVSMHNELNTLQNPNIENINNNGHSPDTTNFNDVYNNFTINYLNKNKSIISDEFYGISNSTTICGHCNTRTYNIQSYNILFFPLEEVRIFMNYNTKFVRINECFEYYEKYDICSSLFCQKCGNYCQAFQQIKLLTTPRTLIVNLNRGNGLQYDINIIFEEYLNLSKYILDKRSPFQYELIGVISHFGLNDIGGHFIAYCKNSNNCQWYKYNDQIVTKITFNEVKEKGMPYILFYSYIDM